MFSTYAAQQSPIKQNNIEITAEAMDISTLDSDIEMEFNPASNIKVGFEFIDRGNKGLAFSLHFKTSDTDASTITTANKLLNVLLTPDCTSGLLSSKSRQSKFPDAHRVGYYLSDDIYSVSQEERRTTGVFNHIAENGTATIAFGHLPRNECPDDGADPFLVTLSMLDDTINLLKKAGCDIDFSMLDLLKNLDEAYTQNQVSCGVVDRPDMNPHELKSVIKFITQRPSLMSGEAILLYYCSLSLFGHSNASYNNTAVYRPETHDDTLFFENNSEQLLQLIDKLTLNLVRSDHRKDDKINSLDRFLRRFNLCNKIKLFSPALGESADDGGTYSWLYTEWDFLRDADFTLDEKTGQMVIDVRENKGETRIPHQFRQPSGYCKYYAPNKPYHHIFSQELKALEVLTQTGLTFKEESDTVNMHNKVEFTPQCSEKLIAMNLHINVESVKRMLRVRNNIRFFEQKSTTGFLHEYLPADVITTISDLVHLKVEDRRLSEEEQRQRAEEWDRYNGRW